MRAKLWLSTLALVALPAAAIADDDWHSFNQGTTTVGRDGRVSFTGQPMVTGSGRIVRKSRPVSAVRNVELKGPVELYVQLGQPLSLTVISDDNLLSHITSRSKDGVLRIDTQGSYRTKTAPKVYLSAPNIESMSTVGSGSLMVSGVLNQRLELSSTGSGKLIATGRTERLHVEVRGSATAFLQGISSKHADVSVVGSGKAYVKTAGALRASSIGTGKVYVLGRPSSLDVNEGGSGKVFRVRGN